MHADLAALDQRLRVGCSPSLQEMLLLLVDIHLPAMFMYQATYLLPLSVRDKLS